VSESPQQCAVVDLESADLIVALMDSEHRPLIRERFSDWEPSCLISCGEHLLSKSLTSGSFLANGVMPGKPKLREGSMANAERQMPEHVKAAYRGAVDNVLFLKRQQWLATNYVLLLYVAVFLISAHYFSRTDAARNWLGVITIAAFVIHWWMLHSFQRSIETFRNRLVWVYRSYFSEEERAGLDLRLEQGHIGINLRLTLGS
jgi:hypothetical protein